MCALVRFRPPAKRTFFRFARLQELHHAGELFFVEARSRVTDVDQISVLVVHAEQQRAEARPRLPRLGPPADDELLLVDDFQLTPVRRPLARLVLRIGALGDEAFPAVVERLFVERAAVAALHCADTQQRRAGPAEQPFENRASFDERQVAQVAAAANEHVERDERHVVRRRRRGDVNPPLELLESARLAFAVERHDFAVEYDRLFQLARPLLERRRDFGELMRLLVAEARPERNTALRIDFGDGADAVVFGFVDERRVVERRVHQRREHGLDHSAFSLQLSAIS